MSDAELAAHRLLIVPGGDFMVIGKKLKGTTAAKVRSAVQNGLGYLGICGGDVVAKYPDGTPAIAEGPVGRGWAVLSGVHPEAPDSWRRGMTFATPAAVGRDYAASLISAALQHTVLPHF